MSEITDLRQVQQRVYQLTSFEDGLWDLLLGTIFMLLSIYPVSREVLGPEWNVVLFLSLLALTVVAHLVVRRLVSEPRIGQAQTRRSPKVRLLLIVTAVMVLITFGLVALTLLSPESELTQAPAEASSERGYIVELIVLLALGGLFSAMGYVFGVKRLYFYGWMLGLANLASVYLEHNAGWTFQIPLAIAAAIILLIGLVILLHFLQKYTVRVEES